MISLNINDSDKKWANKIIDECLKNYQDSNGNSSNVYLPTCLNNLRVQIEKGVSKDFIINFLIDLKKLSIQLFNKLVNSYSLEYQIPINVDPSKDIAIYAWPSILSDGNDVTLYSLTLYNWFSFSFKPGDGKSELEPITFLFNKKSDTYEPLIAYARVHYDLCEYSIEKLKDIKVIFARYGHTPFILNQNYVRVRCPKVKHSSSRTGRKYWDRMWLTAGNIFTRITGVRKIQFKAKNILKINFLDCLPKTANNPFKSPIYPLQFF